MDNRIRLTVNAHDLRLLLELVGVVIANPTHPTGEIPSIVWSIGLELYVKFSRTLVKPRNDYRITVAVHEAFILRRIVYTVLQTTKGTDDAEARYRLLGVDLDTALKAYLVNTKG